MRILAVTACPTGIAHTYMAAENLEKAAGEMGVDIKVETQGSIGAENVLTKEEIKAADGIIIASDKDISKDRFAGKPLVVVPVKDGVSKPEELIKQIQDGKANVYKANAKKENDNDNKGGSENKVYRHLMNGVSYMIPFIVVGGLLIAISLALGGNETPEGIVIPDGSFWSHVEAIGAASFGFMVPILAGFIAVSIADRPGLVPGMVGGFIAANGDFYGSAAGAGFIGGIIAGFLAGYVALGIKKIKVPKAIQPVMPIIFIPVISSFIVGVLFIFIIGAPVAGVFEGLTGWLQGMQGASSILLAVILGAMIAVDMGGPFNKVAFLFGSAMIAEGNYEIMGAIAAAICIPPLGMGLATFLNKRKYNPAEQETGKASFTMGLFGITEGAIPFAAQDPLRVIPSIVVGSSVGAVIAMLGGVGDHVAHGGPIVAVLGAVDNVLMFFIAAAVGTVITAFLINLLKKDVMPKEEVALAGGGSVAIEDENEEEQTEEETTENIVITQLTDILTKDLIDIDLNATTQDEAISSMTTLFDKQGILNDRDTFKEAIYAREKQSTTGLGMNIAIPHAKTNAVNKPAVAFARVREGIDWNSMDGTDAKLIFMIAVPEDRATDDHLKILQMLSRKLMDEDFRNNLLEVINTSFAYELLEEIK